MERRHYVPMDKNEKARIVDNVEKKLTPYIIDANTEVHKVVHITKTVTIEEEIESPTVYNKLFEEALSQLFHLKNETH